MDDMNIVVAGNLKRLRAAMHFSLDELSRRCGVSKSMLARIERGEGNPTLTTLWKVSNGMGVPFDELIARPSQDFAVVRTEDVQPILEDCGRVRNYSVFPDGERRRFAVYIMELDPRSSWTSEAHPRGTTEFITVFEGSLEVSACGWSAVLRRGESLRFAADTEHGYANPTGERCLLHMIMYTP